MLDAGLVADLNRITPGSAAESFVELEQRVIFVADDGVRGKELFVRNADGSTNLLADIFEGDAAALVL